ncbi:Holliday junction branch migration protein RuvA [Thioalkalicoccus limnaeus]|uniref:Holliday junction branch migration complex subunit RuvA n=1 Tax=Thioalkalicoccus limnaeus TaxID=120681 RepID=A0ABV4BEV7_9GAMM
MIGRLRGEILAKQPPLLLIDVQGVGYELEAPMTTFYDLPAVGEQVTLVTHLVVREDAHVLYGFRNESDRTLFRHLLKVTGVGARLALGILSGMDARQFARCIADEDIAALIRLPGIGRKTAQRLVIDMKERVDGLADGLPPAPGGATAPFGADADLADAISALVALGYRPLDANRMARTAAEGATSSEEIIRAALKAVNSR